MPRSSRHPRPASHAVGKDERQAAESFAAGDLEHAEKHCRRALALAPNSAALWHLLAVTQFARDDLSAAGQASARACQLAPMQPDYANTAALICARQGDHAQAAAIWQALLASHPAHADACYNLARLRSDQGALDDAAHLLINAIELRPTWPDAYKNLGAVCFARGDRQSAEAAYIACLRFAPDDVEACVNLARLRQEADDFAGSSALYAAAGARAPDAALSLRRALNMPIFLDAQSDIDAHRARIGAEIHALARANPLFDDPVHGVGNACFYFAYHARNEREFASQIGDLMTRAWRPPPLAPTRAARRPRIAFVSAHLKTHTIARLYAPLFERLPRDGYEIVAVSLAHVDDPLAARIAAAVDLHVPTGARLEQARAALAALAPEVVIYLDLGMDPLSTWLAVERLAPVQCVTWGHPVTSGLPSIDYFLSSTWIEPGDASEHYRETLLALPAWPVIYERPPANARADRARFGFRPTQHIYLCPQSLFKLHPDFDAYLAAILTADPNGWIVLIAARTEWCERLHARFARKLGALAARIRFLPAQDSYGFATLLTSADVVLDTIHFSGGYTSFETLCAERPFVTERGRYMRGRVTAGLCDLIEFELPLAQGAADYAARAIAFATDATLRRQCIEQIAERKERLFALDAKVAAAYADFFRRALAQAARTTEDAA